MVPEIRRGVVTLSDEAGTVFSRFYMSSGMRMS